MVKYNDSLRGYGRRTFERDNFICTYCGEDHRSFKMWRFLTVDHLLPPGDPDREAEEWKVTACSFCNTARNRAKYERTPETKPEDIIKLKKENIQKTIDAYRKFWEEHYGNNS